MSDMTLTKTAEVLPAAATVETNPAAVYLSALQASGRRTMRSALGRIASMFGYELESMPWAELRYEHVQALRTKLAEDHKPATVNKALCAIRGVMHAAWRMGQIDAEHYQRVADVKGVTGATLPTGRSLGPGEMQALMRACTNEDTSASARDAAIIALAYGGGLRRAEIVALDLAHVTEDDGESITLRILGKRNKERLVYLNDGAALALHDWLAVRGDKPGALFWSGRKGGHLIMGQRMTGQAIRDMLNRRARQAGIENVTPHDLRRSFVSDLLDAGVDIATVANMAGHSNIQTTRRYDRRGERAKKRAARSLHVPYVRRE